MFFWTFWVGNPFFLPIFFKGSVLPVKPSVFVQRKKTGLQGVIWLGKKGFCTTGETIRFCATKKTGLQGVIWLVAKKLKFEFQNFKNDDFFNFSFNFLVSYGFFISDQIFFGNFMSKLKISMQQFQLKNCVLRQYGGFSKIQMKPILVSDQFHWNWSETKIKCPVSVKLGTKKRAFLA